MTARILVGDCRQRLRELSDASIDACVTDPPYHLTTGKKGGSGPASVNLDSPYGRARVGTGFMGMTWDGGDVAMQPATWAEVLRVLKPGAYLLAFGGTRTYHRLACAVEDAGFEIRDQLGWVFGSGFPKGTDKAKIPEAWRGWNTALKPAWEPILLARKPMDGTLAENLQRHGCGALNIDGCRIGDGDALGRWPANVIHDGSEEVLEHFPEAPGQLADASSSSSSRKTQNVYGAMKRGNGRDGDSENRGLVGFKMRPGARRGDAGSAARFFYCAKADRGDRDDGLSGFSLVRSSDRTKENGSGGDNPRNRTNESQRNHHPTVKPTDLMRHLCRLVTPGEGTVLDPFMGSGSTGRGALIEGFSFVGIEQDPNYAEIARARIKATSPMFAEVA